MTDDLIPQLIAYYGPVVLLIVLLIWAVLHIGKKLDNMATLYREASSSNLKLIELLSNARITTKDKAK